MEIFNPGKIVYLLRQALEDRKYIPGYFIDHKFSIDSGNGLVLSGNKHLPEPVLINIPHTMWYH